MNRPTSGAARLLRAALLASLVVGLAGGAHAVAGGTVPSSTPLGALVALVLPVAVLVTGRRVGTVGALALLGVGQVLLHAGFGFLDRCVPAVAGSGLAGSTLAGLGGAHAGHAVTSVGHTCAAHAGGHTSAAMLAVHAAATVVTALVVAGAERGLAHVLAYLAPLLRPTRPVVVRGWSRTTVAATPAEVRTALHLRVPPPRRGPPARAARPRPLALAA